MPTDYRALRDWLRSSGYQYWWFLSWARGADQVRAFVLRYRTALQQELRIRLDSDAVFLDIEEIDPGDDWRARLGQALCRSVLMIPVYTPPYFWPEHRYCGLEWGATRGLSQARLGDPTGLFPVVLRAPSQIHPAARGVQWEDLSSAALSFPIDQKRLARLVQSTVDRIIEVAGRLMAATAPANCDQFALGDDSPFDGIYAAPATLPFRGGL
jgi:hypothetical protein